MMSRLLGFLTKKLPLIPAWHFTKNTTFVGAKKMNVICYLNNGHIVLSRKGSCHVATSELIKTESWNKLISAFDKNPSMETDLVEVEKLNATCQKVFEELTFEAETAGLDALPD